MNCILFQNKYETTWTEINVKKGEINIATIEENFCDKNKCLSKNFVSNNTCFANRCTI